ncbi:MAG: SIMPL domain-containing protein [Thermoguttaceae bacterium]
MQISHTWWRWRIVLLLLALLLFAYTADAQMFGARADRASTQQPAVQTIDHRAIENFITIEGTAEKRLAPTALRIVLALMAEAPTASECQDDGQRIEKEIINALEGLGIAPEKLVVDFISILPVYHWEVEKRQGANVAVEKLKGFRMQSNVHVEVPTERQAGEVLAAAFKLGISDIIAFDYWNKDIDAQKNEARKAALKVAKEKADLLLGAMFDDPPVPLNVHESTRVIYPRMLYSSFENAYAEGISVPYSGSRLPTIKAARPKNTYYRGLQEETDVRDGGLPLRPQISIVSTVRLYYATPVTIDGEDDD